MKQIQKFVTKNECFRANKKIQVKGLMIHSVGTPQPSAEVFYGLFNRYHPGGKDVEPHAYITDGGGVCKTCGGRQSCVHAFIEPDAVIQTLPWEHRGWHGGGGTKGNANDSYIGVEMTEPNTIKYTGGASFTDGNPAATKAHATAVYQNAVELFADLCKQYSLNPLTKGVVISHKEGCAMGISGNHGDPEHIWGKFGLTMDMFRSDIHARMKSPGIKPEPPDRYTSNGLIFIRAKNFKIRYADGSKLNQPYPNYINAGFFGNFDENGGKDKFTLPSANLTADIDVKQMDFWQRYYLDEKRLVTGSKIVMTCAKNFSKQFMGKNVTTLCVPAGGKSPPYVDRFNAGSAAYEYAISGIPVMISGIDVSWTNYDRPEGWDESPMYATLRNMLGIREGEIWIISGASATANHVATSETFNKLKGEGVADVIALDGGGSYVLKENGKVTASAAGDRRINNIITWG
jgi:hypothetical protein